MWLCVAYWLVLFGCVEDAKLCAAKFVLQGSDFEI